MNKPDYDNFIDPSEFSLDSILSEYKDGYSAQGEVPASYGWAKETSRRIAMEDSGGISSAQISDDEPEYDDAYDFEPEENASYEPSSDEAEFEEEYQPPLDYMPDEDRGDEFEAEYQDSLDYAPETDDFGYSDEYDAEYAAADYPEYEDKDEDYKSRGARERTPRSGGYDFMRPIISIIAAIMVRRQHRAAAEKDEPEDVESIPEVSPKKAAKLYSSQAKPFKFRGTVSAVLCVMLMYISYGFGRFPMPYSISGDIRVAALLCLLLELVVILTGLDIFTNGITALLRGKPGAESLISVSCLLSILDAAIISATGTAEGHLPFCAVSAISMTFAIFGSRLLCDGMRSTFRTASAASAPFVITAEREVSEDGSVILKSQRDIAGFVRRSEESDASESAYTTAAPFLLISSLIFSTWAGIVSGSFFHCFSALTAVSASFSALLSFPIPFRLVARRLAGSGAAIAGWSGASDIGRSKHTVVTDADLFPPDAVSIGTIRILEGTFTDTVISYTGSMMIAAGCSLAPAFVTLMRRNGCAMQPVEDFRCHEGGGIIGIIRGEQVYVGTSGFMNLMGIRLPQSQISKDAVFTAISGSLVGTFAPAYVATAAIQDALVSMLHNRGCSPLFAIRDFNISPLLVKQKFRMPTESFDFPSVSERYRISGASAGEDSPPAALISREGLAPMIEAVIGGRNIYRATRRATAISILGAAAGMLLMFFLCLSGSFDSAGVSNMMTFMFLWLVPLLVIAVDLRR